MSEDPPSLAAVPRAAAVAGVAFALLFGAALLMVRTDRRFNRMRPSIAPRKRHQAG